MQRYGYLATQGILTLRKNFFTEILLYIYNFSFAKIECKKETIPY